MGRKIIFFLLLFTLFLLIKASPSLARECECSTVGEKFCSGNYLYTCNGCNYLSTYCECGCSSSTLSCKSKYCSSSCECGCSSISCTGGVCKRGPYCSSSKCPCGCSDDTCNGGVCKACPTNTPTPRPPTPTRTRTPTPAPTDTPRVYASPTLTPKPTTGGYNCANPPAGCTSTDYCMALSCNCPYCGLNNGKNCTPNCNASCNLGNGHCYVTNPNPTIDVRCGPPPTPASWTDWTCLSGASTCGACSANDYKCAVRYCTSPPNSNQYEVTCGWPASCSGSSDSNGHFCSPPTQPPKAPRTIFG